MAQTMKKVDPVSDLNYNLFLLDNKLLVLLLLDIIKLVLLTKGILMKYESNRKGVIT